MAGLAKPNVADLRAEAEYRVISGVSNGVANTTGLFDGLQPENEWNTARVHYFQTTTDYIEIDISEDCNIWRSGTTGWISYTRTLKINRWNGTAYVDVTASVAQTTSQISLLQWEKTISNLPKGRYKFEYSSTVGTNGTYRMDSEWYIESVYRDLEITIPESNIIVPKNTDAELRFQISSPEPTNVSQTTPMSESTLGSGKMFLSEDIILSEWLDITKMEVK